MRDKFNKFMQGRYGVDDLSRFTMGVALVLIILAMFANIFSRTVGSTLDILGVAAIVYAYIRIFSRNIQQRYAENQKFLQMTSKFRFRFNKEKDLMKQRKKLSPVRIDLSREMDETVVDALCRYLDVTPDRVFRSEAPLDVSFVFQLQDLLRRNTELFYEKRVPQKSPEFKDGQSILQQITEEDKLLSYPYDSIRPFLKMLTEAAEDDSVISIKMTLYRLAKQSKVIEALCEAAENGKEVVVLVELRARFDEENNIRWSRMLEEAGCQIIYGLEHYKVHSKLCLITRRGENGIQYITQIGTGNYNEKTARPVSYTHLTLPTKA